MRQTPQWKFFRRPRRSIAAFLVVIVVVWFWQWRHSGYIAGPGDFPYFPAELENGVLDGYEDELAAFDEPSLFKLSKKSNAAAYRYSRGYPFGGGFAVRVTKTAEGAELRLAEINNRERPWVISRVEAVSLTATDWANLDALAEETGFWTMATPDDSVRILSDGKPCMMEGAENGRYHVVVRSSPNPGAYTRLCNFTLSLAGRQGSANEILDSDSRRVSFRHFAVLRVRSMALAIRFVEHTEKGLFESDYRGAAYEWFLQNDGSHDFARANVLKGQGKAVRSADHRPEDGKIVCGPIVLKWSPYRYEKCDYLEVNRAECKTGQGAQISMAITDWDALDKIDLNEKYLIWSTRDRW